MKLEHVAINVADPLSMTDWYVKNLGMTIVKAMDKAPFTHFLADDSGNVMIEIYNNPSDQVPDYGNMHPLLLHLAFVSDDPDTDRSRLENVGATFVEEVRPKEGAHLVMMRDPWGLAVQLCKRGKSMLKG